MFDSTVPSPNPALEPAPEPATEPTGFVARYYLPCPAYERLLNDEPDAAVAGLPLILYHSNCLDGFAAAYSAWYGLKGQCVLVPINYNHGATQELGAWAADREVYVVDFCLTAEQIRHCFQWGMRYLTILDHHKGLAEEVYAAIEGQPNCKMIFDNNKSGARLSWEYFCKDSYLYQIGSGCSFDTHADTPYYVAYIEDRDLWRFSLVNTKDFCAALSLVPKTIPDWYHYLTTNSMGDIINQGKLVQAALMRDVEALASRADYWEAKNRKVAVVNAPLRYASELGDYLYCKSDVDFAVIFEVDMVKQNLNISMRSRSEGDDPGFNVAALCRTFGGGGHRNAAGCRVELGITDHLYTKLHSICFAPLTNPEKEEVNAS